MLIQRWYKCLLQPTRLMSPSTLLKRRRGNSFEMATLLCSMLIGAGFTAVVVSGVARAKVVENDQRSSPYPHKILELQAEGELTAKFQTGQTYKLRPMPDLESHLDDNLAKLLKKKADDEQRAKDEVTQREQEVMYFNNKNDITLLIYSNGANK